MFVYILIFRTIKMKKNKGVIIILIIVCFKICQYSFLYMQLNINVDS